MNENQAEALASIVGGEAWQSGGGIWLVTLYREDGKLVVFSGDAVCEYESEEAFDEGRASNEIALNEDGQWWVLSDKQGNVVYRDGQLQTGWRCEEDARREALALWSRTGQRYMVREQ
jgi:hypothetical protein